MTKNKDMAAARAALKGGPRTPPAEILARAELALELLCMGGKPMQIRAAVETRCGCCATGADKALKTARKLMRKMSERSRDDHRTFALSQLELMIQQETGAIRLGAIKAKIDLLGLAEPKQSEVAVQVSVVPYDPARTEAMRDPILRAKLLNLESEISLLPIFQKEPSHVESISAEDPGDPDTRGSCC